MSISLLTRKELDVYDLQVATAEGCLRLFDLNKWSQPKA